MVPLLVPLAHVRSVVGIEPEVSTVVAPDTVLLALGLAHVPWLVLTIGGLGRETLPPTTLVQGILG